jgi:hypothetical protein
MDLGGMAYRSGEEFKVSLKRFVEKTARAHDIQLVEENLPDKFAALIEQLHVTSGEQVVVQVDEYDKPIIDNLGNLELAGTIRESLHDFYQVLKAADDHLRLIFLTGVSKFSKVSVFSGLNNLRDITLSSAYATICGCTREELERDFDEHIRDFAQKKNISREDVLDTMQHWYNGYSWDGENRVYNPFSTLLFLSKQVVGDYWFASATPTFLIDILREHDNVKIVTGPVHVEPSEFDSFEIATPNIIALLFQTGYLTVKRVEGDTLSGDFFYTLDVPNEEVRRGLLKHLVGAAAARSLYDNNTLRARTRQQLVDGDAHALEQSLQSLFAGIPYQLHIKREAYYHSLILLWLSLLGFEVQGEVSTDKGRIDATWIWDGRAIIAEVKYAPTGTHATLLDEAIAQIRDRRYTERFAATHRVTLLAIAIIDREVACRLLSLPE